MTEYLEEHQDTTTDEFNEVWRNLDAAIKEVCFYPHSVLLPFLPCYRAGIRRARMRDLLQMQPQAPPKTCFRFAQHWTLIDPSAQT